MYQLTEFDFDNLIKPWWLTVSVDDPGILTVSNVVSEHSRLYEISEVHQDLESLQNNVIKSIQNFTDTHIAPNPGQLEILNSFTEPHEGVSLRFHKNTGLFMTLHEESGTIIKHYSLADLFTLGPKIIENDSELYAMMVQQGML